MLNSSNRNFKPCNVCDVIGTLMGEKTQYILTSNIYENDLVLKQKKILKIVREYFKRKTHLLKKSYFALYENGIGSQYIKIKFTI